MTRLTLPLLFALSAASIAATLGAPSSAAAPVTRAIIQEPNDAAKRLAAFQKEFRAAQRVNSKTEMARLVKKHEYETIWWVIDICVQISYETSEELEETIHDLRIAWRDAFDTHFVDRMYEYYSLLSGPRRKQRDDYQNQFDELVREFDAASSGADYQLVGQAMKELASKFESVGDRYFAARAWNTYAACNDHWVMNDDANFYAVYEGFEKAVELKEELELFDADYHIAKERLAVLAAEGYDGDPAAGGGGGGAAGSGEPGAAQPAATGPVVSSPMTFEAVDEIDEFERPSYPLDEIYPTWQALFFQGAGSTAKLEFFENGPTFIREEANRVSVDADGDGQGEVDVLLTGAMQHTEFEVGSGPERRKWAFTSVIGIDRDKYQLVDVNLAPSKQALGLYVLPAGSMVGSIEDTEIRVFDDNLDGVYGSHPKYPGQIGTTTKAYVPTMDSIVVGNDDHARPWSRIQRIDDTWYELEAINAGTTIQATALPDLKTGEVELDWDGPVKPSYVVIQGWDPKIENCFYDVAESRKVEVPVGPYRLFYGELRKGKKLNMMKTVIVPEDGQPVEIRVQEGEEAELALGEPFGFDFDYTVDGTKITIQGTSVAITGKAGERYERAWNCRPQPEVVWRKKGTRRASKPEDMRIISNGNEVGDAPGAVGWEYLWFPVDLVLDTRKQVDGEIEVQMFEKKNRLFGKIESDWK